MDVFDDEELVAILMLFSEEGRQRKRRKYWVHPLNMLRPTKGQFHCIFDQLRKFPLKFFDYYRMSIESFDTLVLAISDIIRKQDTLARQAIGVEERLTVTLRYLATGTNFSALRFDFLMGRSTIAQIVRETCTALWQVLQPTEMAKPTKEQWLEISEMFQRKTNFPNCLGCVDGKHIRLMAPANAGSRYFNYKKYHSIVLLAVVDANYCFVAIDVGAYGREGDSNVFKQSAFGRSLYENTLDLPAPAVLPGADNCILPFCFLGDEAFPLKANFLRPYPRRQLNVPQRIFNYRLSRARRYVECAFGILSNKWRVLHSSITVEPDFAATITKATCVLHNFVRRKDGYNFEDTLHCNLEDLMENRMGATFEGKQVRDKLTEYFCTPAGEVPWQYHIVNRNVM